MIVATLIDYASLLCKKNVLLFIICNDFVVDKYLYHHIGVQINHAAVAIYRAHIVLTKGSKQ